MTLPLNSVQARSTALVGAIFSGAMGQHTELTGMPASQIAAASSTINHTPTATTSHGATPENNRSGTV